MMFEMSEKKNVGKAGMRSEVIAIFS